MKSQFISISANKQILLTCPYSLHSYKYSVGKIIWCNIIAMNKMVISRGKSGISLDKS